MRMDGKVVVVSGAASGIGRALCRLLAARGASLGLLDYDRAQLELLAKELRLSGSLCCTQAVDVRERERVAEAVRGVTDQFGPVDVLISSAGICRASTVDNPIEHEAEKVIQTNLIGTVSLIDAALPRMLQRGEGHIVGISSMAGIRGIPYEAAYCASKAAVAAYLESIRFELKPRGITVTTVFPGYVETPLLEDVNDLAGADLSKGTACSATSAASRILMAIERKKAHVYFPWRLGLGLRLSQLLPPSLYDWLMRCEFGRLPLSRGSGPNLAKS